MPANDSGDAARIRRCPPSHIGMASVRAASLESGHRYDRIRRVGRDREALSLNAMAPPLEESANRIRDIVVEKKLQPDRRRHH